jgi:hypothetical protein
VKPFIKIFTIWLIVIAVPVQGLASAAMINCVQSASHQNQKMAADHHSLHSEHHLADPHVHSTPIASNDTAIGKVHGTAKGTHACAHCVKCTSCCAGFTFQSTASSLFQQLSINEARLKDGALPLKGFIPSGLERPPKFSLSK